MTRDIRWGDSAIQAYRWFLAGFVVYGLNLLERDEVLPMWSKFALLGIILLSSVMADYGIRHIVASIEERRLSLP